MFVVSTRKISVYGYYGDDDPGTSGYYLQLVFVDQELLSFYSIFNISGTAAEAFAVPFAGRGNLFGLVSKEERRTFAYHPEGGFTVSGEVEDAHVRDYTGSGSVFSLNSAEESLSRFVPATFTVFKVTGDAVIRITARIFGRGDLSLWKCWRIQNSSITAGIFEFFGVARRKVTRAESGSVRNNFVGASPLSRHPFRVPYLYLVKQSTELLLKQDLPAKIMSGKDPHK